MQLAIGGRLDVTQCTPPLAIGSLHVDENEDLDWIVEPVQQCYEWCWSSSQGVWTDETQVAQRLCDRVSGADTDGHDAKTHRDDFI